MKKASLVILAIAYNSCVLHSQNPFTNLKSNCVQMHIHGISNHNGNNLPGSMQYHNYYATQTNTNVIWWSDHMHAYHQYNTSLFNFSGATFNSNAFELQGLTAPTASFPDRWKFNKYIGGSTYNVSASGTKINLALRAESGTKRCFMEAFPRGGNGPLTGTNEFGRTLLSEPVITFNIKPSGLNATTSTKIKLIVYLSYHHYDGSAKRQKVVYNFIRAAGTYSLSTDSNTVTVNVPVRNNIDTTITINMASMAAYLKNGKDNTIGDYRLLVEAKNKDTVSASFSAIQITSNKKSHTFQWNGLKQLGNNYKTQYAVQNYFGSEFSFNFVQNNYIHFNGFVPESAANADFMHDSTVYNASTASSFISLIKNAGGVVSYNHPFGAARYNVLSDVQQDSLVNVFANYILSVNGNDCDMIEIGYISRGYCDLAHHIQLWDKLNANELFMYANAVGDRHGGNWFDNENPLSTWIFSIDRTSENLISSIKKGRMFFGNNIKYDGRFYIKIGNNFMGDKNISYKNNPDTLEVIITNALPGSTFKYTHGKIKPGLNVKYFAKDSTFTLNQLPVIDRSQPGFVYVTVTDNTGEVYLVSNPIIYFNELPDRNCATSHVAVEISVQPTVDVNNKTLTINSIIEEKADVSIVDLQGKEVFRINNLDVPKGTSQIEMSLQNIIEGIYLVHYKSAAYEASTKMTIARHNPATPCRH
ncbi:MAG: T9SS type A sorting domain-containing protein [Bacteroidetes bacterium]|nr:T9SS type A sorting domain-containing protein [Bacteroidota bacterium]